MGRSRLATLVTAVLAFAPSPQKKEEKEEQAMPIVPKEPTIVKREICLEQPTSDLLDDYARFIESRADHVVNSVLKKTLAKDRDYKRWKSQQVQRETASPATRKAGS